jgi:hypothetical protein
MNDGIGAREEKLDFRERIKKSLNKFFFATRSSRTFPLLFLAHPRLGAYLHAHGECCDSRRVLLHPTSLFFSLPKLSTKLLEYKKAVSPTKFPLIPARFASLAEIVSLLVV